MCSYFNIRAQLLERCGASSPGTASKTRGLIFELEIVGGQAPYCTIYDILDTLVRESTEDAKTEGAKAETLEKKLIEVSAVFQGSLC